MARGGLRQVAVVGPGEATAAQEHDAERIGVLLAGIGATVVTGGLGGVMAAAARGAAAAGGRTVGLLPGSDPAAANEWSEVVIPTGLGEARNALVVRAARVVVAVGFGWGTLSEVALALRAGTPVVSLGSWVPLPPAEEGWTGGRDAGGLLRVATGPDDAVRLVLSALSPPVG